MVGTARVVLFQAVTFSWWLRSSLRYPIDPSLARFAARGSGSVNTSRHDVFHSLLLLSIAAYCVKQEDRHGCASMYEQGKLDHTAWLLGF